MAMTFFVAGKPIMADFDAGSTTYSAGDVVVVGGIPCVAHEAIPAFTGGSYRDALAVGGGIYDVTGDAAYAPGTRIHWDPTQSKVTTGGGGNTVPFGFVVGGASGRLDDSGSTTCRVLHAPEGSDLAYSAAAASTAVTTTTTETLFSKSLTIPANTLQPGDVIRVRAQAIATATNSTDTLTLKLYVGGLTGTAVANTGAVDVANSDIGYFDFDVVIRTIGASGTLVAAGVLGLGASGTITAKAAFLASTTIDTTAAQVVGVGATWSTNNAGNSCRLDVLDVQILRK